MAKTLFEIKDNVRRVGERIFNANGLEFQRGFNVCFEFFQQELDKSTLYHQSILLERINELECALDKQNRANEKISKVSQMGVMVVEQSFHKQIESLHKVTEKQRKELGEQNVKINHLNGTVQSLISKNNKLKAQNELLGMIKADKKYKKMLEFIQYNNLEEALYEFHKDNKESTKLAQQ